MAFTKNSSGLEALKAPSFLQCKQGTWSWTRCIYGITACADSISSNCPLQWASGHLALKVFHQRHLFLILSSALLCFCFTWAALFLAAFLSPSLKKFPIPGCCLSPHSQDKVAGAVPRASEGLENRHPFQWRGGCFYVFHLCPFVSLFGIWSRAMHIHLGFHVHSLHRETFTSLFLGLQTPHQAGFWPEMVSAWSCCLLCKLKIQYLY